MQSKVMNDVLYSGIPFQIFYYVLQYSLIFTVLCSLSYIFKKLLFMKEMLFSILHVIILFLKYVQIQ